MCQYDVEASNKRKGKDNSLLSSTTTAFDDLINPFQQDTGLGKLASNLNMQNYLNNDSKKTKSTTDTSITPTEITNLDARQGEGDPSLRKRKRNKNNLRIRGDVSKMNVSPKQSMSSGTTKIIT